MIPYSGYRPTSTAISFSILLATLYLSATSGIDFARKPGRAGFPSLPIRGCLSAGSLCFVDLLLVVRVYSNEVE
jgi:hypothetical protein